MSVVRIAFWLLYWLFVAAFAGLAGLLVSLPLDGLAAAWAWIAAVVAVVWVGYLYAPHPGKDGRP